MPCRMSFLFAILASAFAVISAAPFNGELEGSKQQYSLDPHFVEGSRISILKREYFVRFSSYKEWKKPTACGGIRLNEKWILTVADCFDRTKFNTTKITMVRNHSYLSTVYRDTTALKVVTHPKFDPKTNAHKLVLVNSTEFDNVWSLKKLHPILPSKNEHYETYLKKSAVVTSMDILRDPNNFSEIHWMSSISVKMEDQKLCEGFYDTALPQTDQICTIPWIGKGLGEGDIGVPLVIPDFRANKLIGLATIVKPAVKDNQPLVFTKIGPYVDWINKVIGKTSPN